MRILHACLDVSRHILVLLKRRHKPLQRFVVICHNSCSIDDSPHVHHEFLFVAQKCALLTLPSSSSSCQNIHGFGTISSGSLISAGSGAWLSRYLIASIAWSSRSMGLSTCSPVVVRSQ